MLCPKCGKMIKNDDVFCAYCGETITPAAPTEPVFGSAPVPSTEPPVYPAAPPPAYPTAPVQPQYASQPVPPAYPPPDNYGYPPQPPYMAPQQPSGGGKKGGGMAAIIAVLCVLLAAAIGLLIFLLVKKNGSGSSSDSTDTTATAAASTTETLVTTTAAPTEATETEQVTTEETTATTTVTTATTAETTTQPVTTTQSGLSDDSAAKSEAAFYSTRNRPTFDEFEWCYGQNGLIMTPPEGAELIDNYYALGGGWKDMIIFEDTKDIGSTREIDNIELFFDGDRVTLTVDWYYAEPPYSEPYYYDDSDITQFTGSVNKNLGNTEMHTTANISGDVVTIDLHTFWRADGKQYGFGTLYLPDGTSNYIALVRK